MRTAARATLLLLGLSIPTLAGERVQFVFEGVDRQRGLAMLRPSACPAVGVQVESGPRTLERNHVLNCTPEERVRVVHAKDGDLAFGELALLCDGGQVLVVKGLQFVRSEEK